MIIDIITLVVVLILLSIVLTIIIATQRKMKQINSILKRLDPDLTKLEDAINKIDRIAKIIGKGEKVVDAFYTADGTNANLANCKSCGEAVLPLIKNMF